jgi:threonine dehydrogenase-like Zn-dependent dehydrogenase
LLTSALLVGTAVGLVAGIASTLLVKAVHPQAFGQAIGLTGRGGTIVFNGLPPGDFPAPIFDIVLKGLTIRGSIVGTRQDMAEALDFLRPRSDPPARWPARDSTTSMTCSAGTRPDRRPHRHRLPKGLTARG